MTQKEIDAIRPGDVIYDIRQNKGYHIINKESGWVQYEDHVGSGTIPLIKVLRWNFVSLMRDREPERLTWEDMEKIHHIINLIDPQHCDNMEDFYSQVLREYYNTKNQ